MDDIDSSGSSYSEGSDSDSDDNGENTIMNEIFGNVNEIDQEYENNPVLNIDFGLLPTIELNPNDINNINQIFTEAFARVRRRITRNPVINLTNEQMSRINNEVNEKVNEYMEFLELDVESFRYYDSNILQQINLQYLLTMERYNLDEIEILKFTISDVFNNMVNVQMYEEKEAIRYIYTFCIFGGDDLFFDHLNDIQNF